MPRRGFSMVELLVVVLIIALLAGASAAMYTGTFKRMAVEKAAKEMMLAARYARMAAVEEQRPAVLNIDAAEQMFFVTMMETDAETGERKEVPVVNPYSKPVRLPDGVGLGNIRISSTGQDDYTTGNSRKIWFNPDGSCESSVIEIGDGTNFATLSISGATGKVRIAMEKVDDPNTDVVDLDGM